MQHFCLVCSWTYPKQLEECLVHTKCSWAMAGAEGMNKWNQESHLALGLECPLQLGFESGPAYMSTVGCKEEEEPGSHSAWWHTPLKAVFLPGLAVWPSDSATPPVDAGFQAPSPSAKGPVEIVRHLLPWGALQSFEETEAQITQVPRLEMTLPPW